MMTPNTQHDALSLFATKCHEVLEANMHKNGWDQDNPIRLMQRVREEMAEVDIELHLLGTDRESLEALERECADVANLIMMVQDVVKRRRGK